MKFEEAFCSEMSKLITVDEAAKIFRAEPAYFANKIKGNLLCPECRKPKLSFNNASTPYFSTYPLDQHDVECPLRQEEMTQEETKAFIKNSHNIEAIQRQAESLLAMLLSSSTGRESATLKEHKLGTALASIVNENRSKTVTRIPRKRIDTTFSEDDYDCYKLFYGTVHVQWEDERSETKVQHKLLLRSISNGRLLCKLNLTEKVYRYIDRRYKSPTEFNCKIVFLATFSHNKVGKSYHTTTLNYGQWLCLEKE